jgi:RNA recognition motif-containing protein
MEGKEEEVRTLFISGFPPDVVYREIYNLFRREDGFESCVLNVKGKGPIAFVTLASQEAALESKTIFNGVEFDPHSDVKLKIELAKANSLAKPSNGHPNRKRIRFGDSGAPFDKRQNTGPYMVRPLSGDRSRPAVTTLFVANLGTQVTADDLQALFSQQPGFRRLNFKSSAGRSPIAFVDFVDSMASGSALDALQGYNGMRIEFAKNSMKAPSMDFPASSGPSDYGSGYGGFGGGGSGFGPPGGAFGGPQGGFGGSGYGSPPGGYGNPSFRGPQGMPRQAPFNPYAGN